MKILVCGDVMQDEYLRGSATRLSPEAPVPVVSVAHTETRPGGAGNVAANIESMGIPCERMYGGGDRIRKLRLMAGRQHIARIDYDYPQTPVEAKDAYHAALMRCEIVVFIDYGKGSLAHIQALLAFAHSLGRKTLIDPKGHDFAKYRGATLIKPNREEMRELVGGWASNEQRDAKAHAFLQASGIESLLLTQAADGMTLYTPDATLHQPAENSAPVDVSGAGEAAIAAYAVALAKGYSYAECLRYASRAAGVAISRQGTTIVSAEELWN